MRNPDYMLFGRIPDDTEELCEAVSAGKKVFYIEDKEDDDDWYYQARCISQKEFDILNGEGSLDPWNFIIDPIIAVIGGECTLPKGSYNFVYASVVIR